MLPQFRKTDTDGSRAQPPSVPQSQMPGLGPRQPVASLRPGAGTMSIIGPDLIIQGNLISKGEVQIEGEVQGDIHGTHLIIGEKARITGGIIAEECVIRGHVLGTVRGRRVLLQNSSHVEGDIYHQTLAIEQGAFFEGKSRRTEDPLAGIPRTEERAPARMAEDTTSGSPFVAPPKLVD